MTVLQVRDGEGGLSQSGGRHDDGTWSGWGHIFKEESTGINEVNVGVGAGRMTPGLWPEQLKKKEAATS